MSVACCRRPLALLWLLVLFVPAADAQVIGLPERVFQPETNPQGKLLALETELLGGYDDNLQVAPGHAFLQRPGGFTGLAATRVRYQLFRPQHSFEARGGGFLNSYSTVGASAYGGDLVLRGRRDLGRRTVLDLSQDLRSDPFFTLGASTRYNRRRGTRRSSIKAADSNRARRTQLPKPDRWCSIRELHFVDAGRQERVRTSPTVGAIERTWTATHSTIAGIRSSCPATRPSAVRTDSRPRTVL